LSEGSNATEEALDPEAAFSSDIYREMHIESLRQEYLRTKNEKYQFRSEIMKGMLDERRTWHYMY
jgi:hypothetical protein